MDAIETDGKLPIRQPIRKIDGCEQRTMFRASKTEHETFSFATKFWQFIYTLFPPSITLLLMHTIKGGTFIGFLIALVLQIIVLLGCVCLLLINLINRRFRLALSIFLGFALCILLLWNGQIIGGREDDLQFSRQRTEFDEMVRRERIRRSSPDAIRMVVKYEDRSVFVTTNSFFYIIYDETDEAIRSPDSVRGYWPYPKSETGVISVGGRKTVQHIAGHYYSFWTSD